MNASNSLNTHARILSSFFADIQSLDRELDAIWEMLRNSIAWQPPSHELIRVENGSTMNDGMVDRIEMELNEVNQTLRRLEIELQPDRK